MCEKAVDFLKRYVRDLLEGTGKYQLSYDIWEENEGVHLYSLAAIFAAFNSMIKIYNVLGKNVSDFENNRLKEEKVHKNVLELEELQVKVKNYIDEKLYDENRKSYVRNAND